MVNMVLLAGKILFLLFLYLFVYWVIRASTRDMRISIAHAQSGISAVQPQSGPPGAARMTAGPPVVSGVTVPVGEVAGAAAGRSTGGTWALVVEQSPHAGEGWAFVIPLGARMIAGRADDVDIHLPDTFVSSHHVRVEARSDGLLVIDLGSTNGTFVNDEEIAGPVVAGLGDRVAVGDSVFRVEAR